MSERPTHELLKTTCTECESIFQLNLSQLLAADGKVRCNQCGEVFDANINLIRENLEGEPKTDAFDDLISDAQSVSLHEAMNEGDETPSKNRSSLLWLLGILVLVGISFIQWVYFERLTLIKDPQKQHLVLSVCSVIPCDTTQFKSTQQFTLIERNIFTHPTRPSALLISGSFMNEAPFTQKTPLLKVSLFNLNAEIIAQRLFAPSEYSQNKQSIESIAPGESIQFKLEVEDPKTVTITYEFEFL